MGIDQKYHRGDASPNRPGKVFRNYDIGKLGQIIERWITIEALNRYNAQHAHKRKTPEGKTRDREYRQQPHVRELIAERARILRAKDIGANRAYQREYIKTPKARETRRKCDERRRSTINGRIMNSIRSRIYHALLGKNKSNLTINLLGCSIDQFKDYLQCRFSAGMQWSNYGKWHVDHDVPLRCFDLSDPDQQKKAFNYKNCIPMWAGENASKNDRIPGELFRARDIYLRK